MSGSFSSGSGGSIFGSQLMSSSRIANTQDIMLLQAEIRKLKQRLVAQAEEVLAQRAEHELFKRDAAVQLELSAVELELSKVTIQENQAHIQDLVRKENGKLQMELESTTTWLNKEIEKTKDELNTTQAKNKALVEELKKAQQAALEKQLQNDAIITELKTKFSVSNEELKSELQKSEQRRLQDSKDFEEEKTKLHNMIASIKENQENQRKVFFEKNKSLMEQITESTTRLETQTAQHEKFINDLKSTTQQNEIEMKTQFDQQIEQVRTNLQNQLIERTQDVEFYKTKLTQLETTLDSKERLIENLKTELSEKN